MARDRTNRQNDRATRSNHLWADVELRTAVEAYLYLSRLEKIGLAYSEGDLTKFLLSGPLRHRNDASVRYRMRNISFVFQTRGWPTLRSYSPAAQVGTGVRARIEAILDSHSNAEFSFLEKGGFPNAGPRRVDASSDRLKQAAEECLELLEKALTDLAGEFVGIGHNHPPEAIDDVSLTAGDLQSAAADARQLREELTRTVPDVAAMEAPKRRLLCFGLKLATWVGERFTKFADAALVTLAPVAVAKATNLMPLIVEAIKALTSAMGH